MKQKSRVFNQEPETSKEQNPAGAARGRGKGKGAEGVKQE